MIAFSQSNPFNLNSTYWSYSLVYAAKYFLSVFQKEIWCRLIYRVSIRVRSNSLHSYATVPVIWLQQKNGSFRLRIRSMLISTTEYTGTREPVRGVRSLKMSIRILIRIRLWILKNSGNRIRLQIQSCIGIIYKLPITYTQWATLSLLKSLVIIQN